LSGFFVLYKYFTVFQIQPTQIINSSQGDARCDSLSMETPRQQFKVNFSTEIRQSNSVQKEAGKRLFKSLIARAQNTAKARAQAVGGAPPAVSNQSIEGLDNPPSLTNRGDSMYRC